MMYELLKNNRTELIERCRAKAARRLPSGKGPPQDEDGIPRFLTQLIETFRRERTPDALARHKAEGHGRPSLALVPPDIASAASRHGVELRTQGFTIDQVVHGYGDLCQALTELALEKDAPITVDEFHTFNRCLDDAIADAVTAFSDAPAPSAQADVPSPGLESPDQEMLSLIERAIHSFAAIKGGDVGVKGTTATLHEGTLLALRNLVERNRGQDRARAIISPARPGSSVDRAAPS